MNSVCKNIFVISFFTGGFVFCLKAQIPCYCKLNIDSTFSVAPMTVGFDTDVGVPPLYENDNATTPAMHLPFLFCFYGQEFDSVFIGNKGIVSFVQPIHTFIDSTQNFPLGHDTLLVAPFYADANTNYNSGVVYYKITDSYLAVVWDSVRYTGIDVDGWNYFQLIITEGKDPVIEEGNNISFCYALMQWACSDASGGFSGYNGTPAFIGLNKGDGATFAQIDRIHLPGFVYYGDTSSYNGVDWLDGRSFTLNSCVSGNVIPPVIVDDDRRKDTIYVCPCDTNPTDAARGTAPAPCDTLNLPAYFLYTGPSQTAALSYSLSSALSNYWVDTITGGAIDTIALTMVPLPQDSGILKLTFTATDSVNNLQSTVTYIIDITPACKDSPPLPPPPPPPAAVREARISPGFSVYPNPAGRNFVIRLHDNTGEFSVKVCDILGAEVESGPVAGGAQIVDVSNLARGMYFVSVLKDNILLGVKKIILQ